MGTIQQNNNVIDGVNLRAEAKRFTHRRCSIDTVMSIPREGRGISLIKAGNDVRQVQSFSKKNHGQRFPEFQTAKLTKFQYK